uniref:EF-hand domain-containing protein n=1 Tax=Arcella intermedia TaxID=1963864 RepID=A0A6B2LKW6_9EUKA
MEVLYAAYSHVSGLEDEDGLIDIVEFKRACGWEDSKVAERIFHLFDINNDGHVNFEEFVSGLAIFKSGSTEEKLKFSFRLYDVDGDGFIQKKELLEMLRASLLENCTLNLSSSQLERIIDSTFKQVDTNSDDQISFEEYSALVSKDPYLLDCFKFELVDN